MFPLYFFASFLRLTDWLLLFSAMVKKLDESVGDVVGALRDRAMLDNTIILFLADNGAPTRDSVFPNWGSNFPLRGVSYHIFVYYNRQTCVGFLKDFFELPSEIVIHLRRVTGNSSLRKKVMCSICLGTIAKKS